MQENNKTTEKVKVRYLILKNLELIFLCLFLTEEAADSSTINRPGSRWSGPYSNKYPGVGGRCYTGATHIQVNWQMGVPVKLKTSKI